MVEETIDCVKLEYWRAAANIERIDLIILDVEGPEVRVIRGAKSCISKLIPNLIVIIRRKILVILIPCLHEFILIFMQ